MTGAAVARRTLGIERGTAVNGAIAALFLAIVLFALPSLFGAEWVTTFTSVAIYSVVAAGLGILYGRVGMISLGQIAILGIGAWTATRLSYATGLPFPLLLVATGVITCAIGVLIGLPALRLTGLYLALITLMAAGAVTLVLTHPRLPERGRGFAGHTAFVDSSGLEPVRRPAMAIADTAFYRYVVIVSGLMFLLALVHVVGKPGRAWAAIRESEPAALAAGVNITLYKMWAFALASFMTGVAGCLLAAQVGYPTRHRLSRPGLPHPSRHGTDRRHLQPPGCDRGRRLLLARAVHPQRAAGGQLELPLHHLRDRPPPGAPDRSGRDRAAVPEGHGEPGAPDRARRSGARRRPGGVAMIEVEGLTVRFAGVTPIDEMSVVFASGTCGLIGPNGAGKTTFFNVLSGFVNPATRFDPSFR